MKNNFILAEVQELMVMYLELSWYASSFLKYDSTKDALEYRKIVEEKFPHEIAKLKNKADLNWSHGFYHGMFVAMRDVIDLIADGDEN